MGLTVLKEMRKSPEEETQTILVLDNRIKDVTLAVGFVSTATGLALSYSTSAGAASISKKIGWFGAVIFFLSVWETLDSEYGYNFVRVTKLGCYKTK